MKVNKEKDILTLEICDFKHFPKYAVLEVCSNCHKYLPEAITPSDECRGYAVDGVHINERECDQCDANYYEYFFFIGKDETFRMSYLGWSTNYSGCISKNSICNDPNCSGCASYLECERREKNELG